MWARTTSGPPWSISASSCATASTLRVCVRACVRLCVCVCVCVCVYVCMCVCFVWHSPLVNAHPVRYKYELCLFDRASQESLSGGRATSLGSVSFMDAGVHEA
jgi:hypothetical protein